MKKWTISKLIKENRELKKELKNYRKHAHRYRSDSPCGNCINGYCKFAITAETHLHGECLDHDRFVEK